MGHEIQISSSSSEGPHSSGTSDRKRVVMSLQVWVFWKAVDDESHCCLWQMVVLWGCSVWSPCLSSIWAGDPFHDQVNHRMTTFLFWKSRSWRFSQRALPRTSLLLCGLASSLGGLSGLLFLSDFPASILIPHCHQSRLHVLVEILQMFTMRWH